MATEVKTMEIKRQERQEQNVQAQESGAKKFKVREWIEEIKHEIRTVHWTDPGELRVYTQIVVGATFFFGMGVYLVDLTISGAMEMINWISRILIG